MAYLKVKVSFPSFMFDTRGLVKLGRSSVEELALSSWWSSLAAKLTVSSRMELVSDTAADTKRKMRANTLGVPFSFLSLS